MRKSIVGLIALGLIAAFSAALLMAAVGKPVTSLGSGADKDITILVAARDIPAVSLVRTEDLVGRTIKAKDAPAGAIQDSIRVIGQTLTRPVVKGQPITSDCFAGGNRGMDLVANLPPGKRAVTIDLKLSAGLEGLLYPGSVVDVLAFFRFDRDAKMRNIADAVSTTLLQGVEVLAIDDETAATSKEDAKSREDKGGSLSRNKTRRITLLVDSRQAEALQLASVHGTISLAMRNPLDKMETDRDATLLSSGQLASLAEYLGSWVGDDGQDVNSAPAIHYAVAAAPVGKPQTRIGEWTVTIMRGDQVEIRSFIRDVNGGQHVTERLH